MYDYFCTVGRGLESFALSSLGSKGESVSSKIIPGKLLFSVEKLPSLHELICVERVFVCIGFKECASIPSSRYEILGLIFSCIVESGDALRRALEKLISNKEFWGVSTIPEHPRFRVNCKCRGGMSKSLNFDRLASQLGRRCSMVTGWKCCTRNADLEMVVHISDSYIIGGLTIPNHSVAKRGYLVSPGLRSTICEAMVSLGKLTPGMVVLDPMCGSGTLLIEASHRCDSLTLLGSDIAPDILDEAERCLRHAKKSIKITHSDLIVADVRRLPFSDKSIDRILCDIPFGKRQDLNVSELYPRLLGEMKRVLAADGLIILLAPDVWRSDLEQMVAECGLRFANAFPVTLGLTEAVILVIHGCEIRLC